MDVTVFDPFSGQKIRKLQFSVRKILIKITGPPHRKIMETSPIRWHLTKHRMLGIQSRVDGHGAPQGAQAVSSRWVSAVSTLPCPELNAKVGLFK